VQAAQHGVVLGEPAGQRHRKVRELPRGPHPADRQVGQHLAAAFPVDQRIYHRGGRHPGNLADYGVQLNSGRFQCLLQPLDL
jgi:hypothetical protein